jgi:Dyp-type peroxidase family
MRPECGDRTVESLKIWCPGVDLDGEVRNVLEELGKLEPKLPKDVSLPAPSGDAAAESEPVYDLKKQASIQGNIIPGFRKDHQHFLFLRLGNLKRAKQWLRWIAPMLTSMEEALAFVREHRALRLKLGVTEPAMSPAMSATWVNLAFSYHAIEQLAGEADAAAFGDQSFRQGLAARSTYLGDPTNRRRNHPGHISRWVVGRPGKEADILVIVAADRCADLVTAVGQIRRQAEDLGLLLLFEQRGDTLPEGLRGREHFGFKDDVSQPGVRGKVSTGPGDFITPRFLDPADPRARFFAKPGQLLVWPGQFLLGEPRQHTEDLCTGASPAQNFPAWAALGSYLVCRRLRQEVVEFWRFAIAAACTLGVPPVRFASLLVGRWPSGAPIMRTPATDDAALAGDAWANNHFIFDDNTRPSMLRPIEKYAGDGFPQAAGDLVGAVCPHFAHIRKTNPRDSATDLGKPHDSMLRMILRRGIPFGDPIVGVKEPPRELLRQERGLMFVCYGSTIEDQFEFLTRRWANSAGQPNFGGHDPIIGQAERYGDRKRFIDIRMPGGPRRIVLKNEWVYPTGGGYFFAPPIEAVTGVLGV